MFTLEIPTVCTCSFLHPTPSTLFDVFPNLVLIFKLKLHLGLGPNLPPSNFPEIPQRPWAVENARMRVEKCWRISKVFYCEFSGNFASGHHCVLPSFPGDIFYIFLKGTTNFSKQ